jgi:hypothetical protein
VKLSLNKAPLSSVIEKKALAEFSGCSEQKPAHEFNT